MRLRPSQAHRWTKCAMFPSAAEKYPEPPEGDEAREGTCAAWLAQLCLTGDAHSPFDLVGRSHKNGVMVTEEMAANVLGYVTMVRKRGGTTTAEEFVTLSTHPDISGTLDGSATRTASPTLYIDDYKNGRGIVEVRNNPQPIIYAAGKIRQYEPGTFNLVQLGIYQPRAFHPHGIYRKWVMSVAELEQRADDIITAGLKCYDTNPVATPGEWCTHCPVAPRCAALAATGYQVAALITDDRHRDMTVLEMSHELDFLEFAESVIEARRKAVVAEAEARSRLENIPGWRMKSSRGNRVLTVDPSWVTFLTGIDATVSKAATPAELLRRGIDGTLVDAVSDRPQLKMKLSRVTEDDIEAAFNGSVQDGM